MKIKGKAYRTIWLAPDGWSVEIIDQTRLPHELVVVPLKIGGGRGARHPLHAGARRAADRRHGRLWRSPWLSARTPPTKRIDRAVEFLAKQRPTAINLRWALEEMRRAVQNLPRGERAGRRLQARRRRFAMRMSRPAASSASTGVSCIEEIATTKGKGETVEVLTHCNAGWLACVDWGTATSPIYQAHDAGVPLHVWVDETRPRNQGASLTAFELGSHGVPHTIVVDNAGGHLMQHGQVDLGHRRH